jgi:allophanate hydrolase subunit 2
VGGAFDRFAHGIANALVGNPPDAASLEMTLLGGTFETLAPVAAALAGAPMSAIIERVGGSSTVLRVPQSFALRRGDRLVIGPCRVGVRTYLATRGGFDVPIVLGSRSCESPLRAGDVLCGRLGCIAAHWPAWPELTTPQAGELRIIDGPEGSADAFVGARFRVAPSSNRTGLRLEIIDDMPGEWSRRIDRSTRLSAPTTPGALQVTDLGPIVLGVACGSMGGYPHVAHVISADMDQLAQLRPGELIAFRAVTLEEAKGLNKQKTRECKRRIDMVRVLACDPLPDLHPGF